MSDKVLYVATVDPFGWGGGPQATRAYLDAIIDIFGRCNVTIMIPEETTVPQEYIQCDFIRVPSRSKLEGVVGMLRGITGRFSKPVVKLIKKGPTQFNWCIFNCGRESGWTFARIKRLTVNKVTIHHNQEVEYCMDNKTIYTLHGRFPFIVKRAEKNAYIFSNYNLFLTQQDKEAFSRLYGYTKANNGIIGTFDFKSAPVLAPAIRSNKQYDFVASGSLSQYQTVHGILDFYCKYLDVSRKLIPDLKILLTGRNPQKEIIHLQESIPDMIDIVQNPIDIQNEVSKGKIYICPTDIGGGLKLRAMDGLKNGLPILIHQISSRGYDMFFSKPYFRVYYDQESFDKALRDILSYLQRNPSCSELINHDYYEYFGYQKGLERLKSIMGINS